MINKKITISVFSILISLSLMGGATYAYFTDSATSGNNTLATGTLNIDIDQSNGIFENSTTVTNWQPDEDSYVRFDVVNNGTLPVYLRSFATGEWDLPTLDENKVKVILVEYWDGSGWADLLNNPSGINGLVYFSSDGTSTGTMMPLSAGDRQEFRLTVELDSTADNTYQGRTFNSSVTVHARQALTGADWPL